MLELLSSDIKYKICITLINDNAIFYTAYISEIRNKNMGKYIPLIILSNYFTHISV